MGALLAGTAICMSTGTPNRDDVRPCSRNHVLQHVSRLSSAAFAAVITDVTIFTSSHDMDFRSMGLERCAFAHKLRPKRVSSNVS